MSDINSLIAQGGSIGATPPPDMMSLYAFAQKIKEKRQTDQSNNALKSIFSDPANLDADGLPKPEAIRKIGAINPDAATTLIQDRAKLDETNTLKDLHKTEGFEKKNKLAHDVRESSLVAYDDAISKGMTPEAAKRQAQSVYDDGVKELKSSGVFSKEESDDMPVDFDPVRVRANSLSYKDWQTGQEKAKTEDREERALTERARHDKADEKLGGSRVGLEGEKVGLEARRLNDTEKAADDAPGLDEDGLDYAATKYRDTGQMPPMGQGKAGAKLRQEIIQRAAKMAKAEGGGAAGDIATAAGVKAESAGLQNLGKMRASVAQAEGNAGREADLVLSLANKGAVPGTPSIINKWVQGARKGVFNDPDASSFQTAVESFKNEYVKVLSTTGGMSGGMSSDAARREADGYINPNLSLSQIKANIAVMRKSMGNRSAAIDKAYDEAKSRIGATGSHPAHAEIARPASKADYQALPKGAHFSRPGDPPGSFRVKE